MILAFLLIPFMTSALIIVNLYGIINTLHFFLQLFIFYSILLIHSCFQEHLLLRIPKRFLQFQPNQIHPMIRYLFPESPLILNRYLQASHFERHNRFSFSLYYFSTVRIRYNIRVLVIIF